MFSYIGMKEASVTVGAANTVNVNYVFSNLEEVVVVGYGTPKKRPTSSISSIKGAAIQNLVTQVFGVNSPVEFWSYKRYWNLREVQSQNL
jgi:hypothetical protein